MIWSDLIARLEEGLPLGRDEIRLACAGLLEEAGADGERADFLRALTRKGISGSELSGFAGELLDRARPFPGGGEGAMDVCGTGGDRAGLFNVSTAVLFVAAGAGARIVKHGNRGVTSQSGGADVLDALGVDIALGPDDAARLLDKAGFCFLFAPAYHPAVRTVAPLRQQLAREGVTTIFNLLGPLLNPARPDFQLTGIFAPDFLRTYAEAMAGLGRQRAWVVHGQGPTGEPLDEASPCGPTQGYAVSPQGIAPVSWQSTDWGIPPCRLEDLHGGGPAENARIIEGILSGAHDGPTRDIVTLNTAAALVIAGIARDIPEGLLRAAEAIDSGAARSALLTARAFKGARAAHTHGESGAVQTSATP